MDPSGIAPPQVSRLTGMSLANNTGPGMLQGSIGMYANSAPMQTPRQPWGGSQQYGSGGYSQYPQDQGPQIHGSFQSHHQQHHQQSQQPQHYQQQQSGLGFESMLASDQQYKPAHPPSLKSMPSSRDPRLQQWQNEAWDAHSPGPVSGAALPPQQPMPQLRPVQQQQQVTMQPTPHAAAEEAPSTRLLDNMSPQSRRVLEDFAARLPSIIKAAVTTYRMAPNLTARQFKQQIEANAGPLPHPDIARLPMNILAELYRKVFDVQQVPPSGYSALMALERAMALPPPQSQQNNDPGFQPSTANAQRRQQLHQQFIHPQQQHALPPQPQQLVAQQQQQQQRQQQQQQQQEQQEPMRPRPPPPAQVDVVCNGNRGVFLTDVQAIACLCPACQSLAAQLGTARVELSPACFEQHSGQITSKKWKYTVRLAGAEGMTLGTFIDEHDLPVHQARNTPHDAIVREMDRSREVGEQNMPPGPPNGTKPPRTHYATNRAADRSVAVDSTALAGEVDAKQHDAQNTNSGQMNPQPAAQLPGAALATASKQLQGAKRRKFRPPVSSDDRIATLIAEETVPGAAASGGEESAGGGVNQASGRAQRKRKQPAWMKSTVDPDKLDGRRRYAQLMDGEESSEDEGHQPPPSRSANAQRARAAEQRRKEMKLLLEAEIDAALMGGKRPELHGWRVTDTNDLAVTIQLGGVKFQGSVPAVQPTRPSSAEVALAVQKQLRPTHEPPEYSQLAPQQPPRLPPLQQYQQQHQQQPRAAAEQARVFPIGGSAIASLAMQGEGAGYGSAFKPQQQQQQLPPQREVHRGGPVPPASNHTAGAHVSEYEDLAAGDAGGGAPHAHYAATMPESTHPTTSSAPVSALGTAYEDDYGPGGKSGGGVNSEIAEKRRERANAEYERLLISGPPPGTKCALCHLEHVDRVPSGLRGPGGRAQAGLGGLLLVRSSATQNTWVHDQCVRWSPEVHDPLGDGILEGVKDAIRRGRMLRCKVCGLKGATLGCLKKTCKSSYHLPCARTHGCLLNIDPYVVACPEHVDQLPHGLSRLLGYSRKRNTSKSSPADRYMFATPDAAAIGRLSASARPLLPPSQQQQQQGAAGVHATAKSAAHREEPADKLPAAGAAAGEMQLAGDQDDRIKEEEGGSEDAIHAAAARQPPTAEETKEQHQHSHEETLTHMPMPPSQVSPNGELLAAEKLMGYPEKVAIDGFQERDNTSAAQPSWQASPTAADAKNVEGVPGEGTEGGSGDKKQQ